MKADVGKGIMAGVIGGLVGSMALRAWMTLMSQVQKDTIIPDQNGPAHQVAAIVAYQFTGEQLSGSRRLLAGEAVHYAFGAVTGGIYGALAEYQPWTTGAAGTLFGTGVFLAADESSMPLLGLVPPPWTESKAAQLDHWVAHLIFGAVTEVSRRSLRRTL